VYFSWPSPWLFAILGPIPHLNYLSSFRGPFQITRDIIIERQPTVIVETPIVLTQPVTVYPEPIYYGYPASYTQIISAPANRCWYQADPYTFLGDVFGYDYDLICR